MSPGDSGISWRPTKRTTLLFAFLAAVGISIAFALVTRRRHETRDATLGAGSSDGLGIATPNLDGPDDVEIAPLVAIGPPSGLAFDHEPVDRSALELRLQRYKANFSVLHPGEPAPHEVLLACSPSVPSKDIFSILDSARQKGFDRARIVFQLADPPSSPSRSGPRITAAAVSLADQTTSQDGKSSIRVAEVHDCAELSERVIALRRAGQPVALAVRASN